MSDKSSTVGWEELDARPNPAWFDHDKIGIFIHWGVFTVPAYAGETPSGKPYGHAGHSCWYQAYLGKQYPLVAEEQEHLEEFHRRCFGGDISYEEVATRFRAELFDATKWADLFARAGARWAIVTSNFHDGFCLWPSPYSPHWNSVDLGPRRDLLGEFSDALRARGLRSGIYYSLLEHNHPLYPQPPAAKPYGNLPFYVQSHLQPQIREVVRRYEPSFIYLDGDWDYSSEELGMRDFLAWLYRESPVRDDVVINDRFGNETRGVHGGVFSSEIGGEQGGTAHKWIEDRPLVRGDWSRNRAQPLSDYLGEREILHILATTLARGGNLHLAVSPYADGTIPMIEQERLLQLGAWLEVNGAAVYGSTVWHTASEGPRVPTNLPYLRHDGIIPGTNQDNWIWTAHRDIPLIHYTRNGDTIFAFVLAWPREPVVLLAPRTTPDTTVKLLGRAAPLAWKPLADGGLSIEFPRLHPDDFPCRHVWTLELSGLANVSD